MVEVGVREWESGWEGHERLQMRRFAALPMAEKLEWLEETQRMVLTLHAENGNPAHSDVKLE